MAPKGLMPRARDAFCRMLAAVLVLLCTACAAGKGEGSGAADFSPLGGLVAFYRGPLDHLSAVRRGECPMFPSCSEYAREAIVRHGEFVGGMMAADRLMRCGRDETRLAPRVKVDGAWRYHDPLDRNDFWWRDAGTPPSREQARP